MASQATVYELFCIMNATMALGLALLARRRRPARGVRSFIILLLCVAEWSFTQVLVALSSTLSAQVFWTKAGYLALGTAPAAWLGFVLRYWRPEQGPTRRHRALLSLQPMITLLLVWTNEAHGIMWRSAALVTTGGSGRLVMTPGPWFWVNAAYSYGLVLFATFLFVRELARAPRSHRGQGIGLLVGCLLVAIGSLWMLLLPAAGGMALAITLFACVVLLGWSLLRAGLFELVAPRVVVENLSDSVIVLDLQGRIVDLNRVAQQLIGRSASDLVGQRLAPAFPAGEALITRNLGLAEAHEEQLVDLGGTGRYLDLHVSPLRDRTGQPIGHVAVLRDVTARRQAQERLTRINDCLLHFGVDTATNITSLTALCGQLLDVGWSLYNRLDGDLLCAPGQWNVPPGYNPVDKPEGHICYDVIRRGEGGVLVVRDLLHSPYVESDPNVRQFQLQTYMGCPVKFGGKFVGSLCAVWDRDVAPSAEDKELISMMAAAIGVEEERRQAEEALRESEARYRELQATVLDITAPHELPTLLHTIVERAARLLNTSGGGLYLCDSERQEARCVVALNTPRDYSGVVLKYGEGAAGVVAQTGKPQMIDDYRTWDRRAAVYEQDQPFSAVLSVPMTWQGQVIGVLDVLEDVKVRPFTTEDLELLTLFANHAAIAVENAKLYQEAQQELAERKRTEEELRRRSQELATLYDTALEIASQLDLQLLLPAIVERAEHLLGGIAAGMYLYRPQHDDLEYVAVHGTGERWVGHVLKRGEGLAGKVLATGQPMQVQDYHQWPERSALFDDEEVGGVLAVPVRSGEQILGVIDLQRERGATFGEYDIRLLNLFANQAALGLTNARLYAESQRRLRELEMLYQASTSVLTTLNLDERLQRVMDAAIEANPAAQRGSLHLLDEERNVLVMKAGHGFSRAVFEAATFPVGQGYTGWALAHNQAVIIDNVQTDPRAIPTDLPEVQEIKSAMVVPLVVKGRAIGTITLDSVTAYGAFSERDQRALMVFAAQAANAIENARLYDAMERELLERRQAEEGLRASNQTLGALIQASPLAIFALDADGNVTRWSGAAERTFGWSEGEVLGRRLPIVPAGRQDESDGLRRKVMSGEALTGVEACRQRKDGSAIDVSISAAPLRDKSGAITGIMGVVADITEHKRMEDALRESERRFRTLFESARDGIVVADAESKIIAANPAATKLLGYASPAELVGASGVDLLPDDEQRRAWFKELDAKGFVDAAELDLTRKDGTQVHVLGGGVLHRDAQGRTVGTEVIFTDITERKRAEEERQTLEAQLRQAQRVEAVGKLAGGIAHEFNNLLMVILGNAELGLSSLQPDHPVHKALSTIQRTAERAAALTRQILAFGRQQILQPSELEVNVLLTNLSAMLGRLIGESIELRTELASDLPPVFVDAGALEQAVVNLVLNARDAMPEGGVLTIETAPTTLDELFCRTHPDARVGDYVRLTVADNGVGIDEPTRAHLFEPFFTTKEVGKGSGLGLSVVYGIVQQHEGLIEVESHVGQGSRFDIYLPAHRVCAKVQKTDQVAPPAAPRGAETILLAEDEEPVRTMVQQVLQGLGYRVLTAADGRQALELFTANQERIDLAVLDAVMPQLSGHAVYEAIRAARPGLPVLFMTGYSADIVGPPSAAQADLPILLKPFALAELGRRVREMLEMTPHS